ncbi:hypothetical protein BDV27DRAFT_130752 [Aspergillus caelatus]|uniref:Uncharacterized protein n=1 Tax=Aspergillus caelatus TaxID=61420 RepID=A0A5N7A193_9EURO|nr:uncharacterized protein BDV27DRAFT_130752 [Aspergillus caelatus]KAE8362956.1 hypothetical protein BDV27DRAFT_130752 [Aspergillus caelatus]
MYPFSCFSTVLFSYAHWGIIAFPFVLVRYVMQVTGPAPVYVWNIPYIEHATPVLFYFVLIIHLT